MRWLGCLAAGVGLVSPAMAQAPASLEVGVAAVGLLSDPGFVGLGPTASIRLSREFAVGLTGVGGWRGRRLAGRGELTLRLDFTRPRALNRWYGAGGLAATTGAEGGGFLVGLVGVERGRRGRWWAEAGFGGGLRLAVGKRWRVGGVRGPRQARSRSRLGATSR
ncbi:MAG: hypothetical protein ACKVZ0_09760 [Gemmatimonadales bacterium]